MTAAKKGKFPELLAVHVAAGFSIKDSAGAVGCSATHAYHLSSDPSFHIRVAAIRSECVSGAVGRLSSAALQAVDSLIELLSQANEPSVRLNAAKAILLQLGPLSELGELRARIDRIEATQLKVHRA